MLTCFFANAMTWILAWSSQWARQFRVLSLCDDCTLVEPRSQHVPMDAVKGIKSCEKPPHSNDLRQFDIWIGKGMIPSEFRHIKWLDQQKIMKNERLIFVPWNDKKSKPTKKNTFTWFQNFTKNKTDKIDSTLPKSRSPNKPGPLGKIQVNQPNDFF